MKRKRSEKTLQKNEIYLAKQNARLEEINVALKVLLEKRDKDKREYEKRIVSQIKQLIDPYLGMLKNSRLSERQRSQLDILSDNLKEIVSPFARNMFSLKLHLTPVEIQVANLVKQGKSSEDIAELLTVTPGTVDLHRKNIRKKCGLNHKKINLRTYLLSFQNRYFTYQIYIHFYRVVFLCFSAHHLTRLFVFWVNGFSDMITSQISKPYITS